MGLRPPVPPVGFAPLAPAGRGCRHPPTCSAWRRQERRRVVQPLGGGQHSIRKDCGRFPGFKEILEEGSRGETAKRAGAATAPVRLVPTERPNRPVRLRTIGVKAVRFPAPLALLHRVRSKRLKPAPVLDGRDNFGGSKDNSVSLKDKKSLFFVFR